MTVGERIHAARVRLGLTQVQLAKRVGVSRGAIYNWERDVTAIRNDKIPRLAGVLGLDVTALSPFGGGGVAPVTKAHKSTYVVLLQWSDLGAVSGSGSMKMSAIRKPGYIEVDPTISPECKALRLIDNSMFDAEQPRAGFAKGDMIIVDPNITPVSGDYVLVRLRQTGEHVFRQYKPRSGSAYDLIAFNAGEYPTLTVNARFPAEIMGVMVEHRRKRATP